MTLDELLLEWSYRLKKGYPDMGSPSDIQVLREILVENDMPADDIIDELEGENTPDNKADTKNFTKDDLIDLISTTEISSKEAGISLHEGSEGVKAYYEIAKTAYQEGFMAGLHKNN